MDKKISDILKDLKELCKKYDSVLPDEKYLSKLDNLEYIVVGDNPGKTEMKTQQYFQGENTNYIRHFFKKIYCNDYEKKVLFLNKTPIYTDITSDLSKFSKECDATQIEMADLIKNISVQTGAHVWIFGFSKMHTLFKKFWINLNDWKIMDPNKIYVFYHPSRGWFWRKNLSPLLPKMTLKEFKEDNNLFGDQAEILKNLEKMGKECRNVL